MNVRTVRRSPESSSKLEGSAIAAMIHLSRDEAPNRVTGLSIPLRVPSGSPRVITVSVMGRVQWCIAS